MSALNHSKGTRAGKAGGRKAEFAPDEIDKLVYGESVTRIYPIFVTSKNRNHIIIVFEHYTKKLNLPKARYIMERFLGGRLPPNLIVHHKDENTLNDLIENLEVMERSDHQKLHEKLKKNAPTK